jgi:hypothetical protein
MEKMVAGSIECGPIQKKMFWNMEPTGLETVHQVFIFMDMKRSMRITKQRREQRGK